ncbi:hypothetical protein FB451DRAFT_1175939 [Mycena latifolia]|nr:hypothetical protein FB451DRAFT_1175939 [Mycena latifolia]
MCSMLKKSNIGADMDSNDIRVLKFSEICLSNDPKPLSWSAVDPPQSACAKSARYCTTLLPPRTKDVSHSPSFVEPQNVYTILDVSGSMVEVFGRVPAPTMAHTLMRSTKAQSKSAVRLPIIRRVQSCGGVGANGGSAAVHPSGIIMGLELARMFERWLIGGNMGTDEPDTIYEENRWSASKAIRAISHQIAHGTKSRLMASMTFAQTLYLRDGDKTEKIVPHVESGPLDARPQWAVYVKVREDSKYRLILRRSLLLKILAKEVIGGVGVHDAPVVADTPKGAPAPVT